MSENGVLAYWSGGPEIQELAWKDRTGKRLGKTSAELGWILEDNKATNNIIRSVGGVHYKTHRLYEKALG